MKKDYLTIKKSIQSFLLTYVRRHDIVRNYFGFSQSYYDQARSEINIVVSRLSSSIAKSLVSGNPKAPLFTGDDLYDVVRFFMTKEIGNDFGDELDRVLDVPDDYDDEDFHELFEDDEYGDLEVEEGDLTVDDLFRLSIDHFADYASRTVNVSHDLMLKLANETNKIIVSNHLILGEAFDDNLWDEVLRKTFIREDLERLSFAFHSLFKQPYVLFDVVIKPLIDTLEFGDTDENDDLINAIFESYDKKFTPSLKMFSKNLGLMLNSTIKRVYSKAKISLN